MINISELAVDTALEGSRLLTAGHKEFGNPYWSTGSSAAMVNTLRRNVPDVSQMQQINHPRPQWCTPAFPSPFAYLCGAFHLMATSAPPGKTRQTGVPCFTSSCGNFLSLVGYCRSKSYHSVLAKGVHADYTTGYENFLSPIGS